MLKLMLMSEESQFASFEVQIKSSYWIVSNI